MFLSQSRPITGSWKLHTGKDFADSPPDSFKVNWRYFFILQNAPESRP
jgi:hypothetical protein